MKTTQPTTPQKKKAFSLYVGTSETDKSILTANDFVYLIDECLSELYDYNQMQVINFNQRKGILKSLFETYFTFMFFSREFNWEAPQEMKAYADAIKKYMGEYSFDNHTPPFTNLI